MDRLRVPHRPRPVHVDRFAPRHQPPDCTAHQLHPSPGKRVCNLETPCRICQPRVSLVMLGCVSSGVFVLFLLSVRCCLYLLSCLVLSCFSFCLGSCVCLARCLSTFASTHCVVFPICARVSMCLRPNLPSWPLVFFCDFLPLLFFVPCDPSNASVAPTASATRLPAFLRRLASCCPLVVPDFASSDPEASVRVHHG